MKKISIPSDGSEILFSVEPNDEVQVEGIGFDQARIDIIGTDVIVSNPSDQSRIVFPGMGLIMFERSMAPKIYFGDAEVALNDFIAKVGEVGNLTVKDFIAISTIVPTDEEQLETQAITNSESEETEKSSESEEESESEDTSSAAATPTEAPVVLNSSSQSQIQSQQQSSANPSESEATSNAPPDSVDEAGDSENEFIEPPGSSGTPAVSEAVSEDEAPPEPEDAISFDLRLLQVPSENNLVEVAGGNAREFLGGGGSQASFFDDENDAQFSTEVADFSNSTIPVIAQTDNPEFFGENLMSRVFQIDPVLPPAFFITNLTISGVPDNFEFIGFERDVDGNVVIIDPETNDRGQINLIVRWETPIYQQFEFNVNATATFDEEFAAENGFETPSSTELTFEVDQKVETRDVFSAFDLNFQDSTGDLVWVMANNPNANRIITGLGDDEITGAAGVDVMNTGDGNDLLMGEGGNDVLSGEAGNDLFIGGTGDDTYIGGSGTDTVSYSLISDNLTLNLSNLNIDGFATITVDPLGPNQEIELVQGVENILGGSGDDIMIGDSNANELSGGEGNDILSGRGGNDRLDGGSGTDTADYSFAGNGVTIDMSLATPTGTVVPDLDVDILVSIENITGSNFDDILIGDDEVNTIIGGSGDDRISGGSGDDIIDGGDGNDFLDYSASLDRVNLNLGSPSNPQGYITASVGTDDDLVRNVESVIGSALNDTITGSNIANTLLGQDGNDVLAGADGDDTLDGGFGNDQLFGQLGADIFIASQGADISDGGDGLDTIDYSVLGEVDGINSIDVTLNNANPANVNVDGGSTDSIVNIENVIGTSGNDRIVGDNATNTIRGMGGDDFVGGGLGADIIDGGEGEDTADYALAAGSINVDLQINTVFDDGFSFSDQIISIENILGSGNDDVILGSDSDNVLDGFNGDDRLAGRGGFDELNGGAGTDRADYSDAGAGVTIDMLTGDTLDDGDGSTDRLDSIENITGSGFNDFIISNDDDNLIETLGGNDEVDASIGADIFDGGDGSDTIDYSGLAAATSIDVDLNVDSDLGTADIDAEVTVGNVGTQVIRNVENVVGSAGQDSIRGDDADNRIDGFDNNDEIRGGLGDDVLFGGNGFDRLYFDDFDGLPVGITLNLVTQTAGFAFDDSEDIFDGFERYFTTNQADTIFGSNGADNVSTRGGDDSITATLGTDTFDGGTGYDTIDYSGFIAANRITVDLDGATPANVNVNGGSTDSVVNIENVTGSQGNDNITGDGEINTFLGGLGNDRLDGAGGDDILEGGFGNDTFIGGAGVDTFRGGQGSDTADYSTGGGFIFADMGSNAITQDAETDTLDSIENVIGTDFDDIILGNAFANIIDAGEGSDRVSGGAGSDDLDGGTGVGIDRLEFIDLLDGAVDINLSAETAEYDFDGSIDTFRNFELYFLTNQGDTLRGSSGADEVYLNGGNDYIYGSNGADVLDGGVGSDTIDYSQMAGWTNGLTVTLNQDTPASVVIADSANDSIVNIENVTGSVGGDTIEGDGLVNRLIGAGGDDVISGGTGSDFLDGGSGDDELRFDDLTGAGVDINFTTGQAIFSGDSTIDTFQNFEVYYMSNQGDTIRSASGTQVVYGLGGDDIFNASAGADTFDGGSGNEINGDTVDYSAMIGATSISVTLNQGTDATVTINGVGETDTIRNIENVTGTTGQDQITGDALGNILRGNAERDLLEGMGGSDQLFGGNDNDTLRGGAGTDTLDGGLGRDTADYSQAAGAVTVDMSLNTTSNDGDAGTDTLISIENVRGSNNVTFGDNIRGDDGVNYIWGGDGNDIIRGGEGSDELYGEAGTDVLRFDELINDGVRLDLDQGEATYLFNGDIDTFTGFEEYITTSLNDEIIGSSGADEVNSLQGDDTFTASNGADILDGSFGNDTIDYSQMTNSGIGINVALDTTTYTDVIVSGVGASDDEIRNFENVIGSAGNDTITGDILNNEISGGLMNDTLAGRGGADTLDGGSGTDTADYTLAAGAINVDLSIGRALNDGDSSTDTLISIENVTGSVIADTIRGDNGANVLDGNFGDDILSGAEGDDTLDGGAGPGLDTADYSFSTAAIEVDMRLSSGQAIDDGYGDTDTLISIENIQGSLYADEITGDNFDNVLRGGQGNDILRGQGGNDTLDGGSNDSLGDTVDYTFAGNSVTVDLSTNQTSNDGQGGQDTLVSIENATGSTENDLLIGAANANTLRGGDGDDELRGLGGNDILDGGADDSATTGVGDTVSYVDAGNGIIVNLFRGDTDSGADGDGGTDTFIGIENITGSGFIDDIIGDDNANRLRGGLSGDTLEGRGGNDYIDGGDGVDTVAYRLSTSGVTVDLSNNEALDGFGGEDEIYFVENILGSDHSDTLTGDGNANDIQGGLQNDILSGRGGVDELDGGAGTDTADYSLANSGIVINMDLNIASNDGDGGTDNFTSIENIQGSNFIDEINGDAGANVLRGGANNDTLYGFQGDDTLDGEGGTDTADYSSAAAGINVNMGLASGQVIDDGDGGTDTLISVENITGSLFVDNITGDDSNNVLRGQDGNDVIDGGLGSDIMEGGNNNDTFIAGLGADTIDGGNGTDMVDYSALTQANFIRADLINDTITVDGAGDDDTVYNVEHIIGTTGNDTFIGDASANEFEGRDGEDTFIGSGGTDTYRGGNQVDVVDYATATSGVEVDLSQNRAIDDGAGASDWIYDVENVYGSAQADMLRGDAMANTIEGRDGEDEFEYSGGGDFIDGGLQADTYDYSTSGATSIGVELDGATYATVTVNGGSGSDEIRNIENIIATDGDDDVRGDTLANVLTLNDGDDIVRGGLGSDDMDGGQGDDGLYFDDLIGAGGITLNLDQQEAFYGGDGSTDTFTGFEEYYLTAQDDIIIGSTGDDVVFGADGADEFRHSDGADTYDGEGGSDIANYSALNATNYIVVTLDSFNPANLEVYLSATDGLIKTDSLVNIENITGTGGNDTITGDSETNTLRGGGGIDALNGGDGNDFIFGGMGDDVILASGGQNDVDGGQGSDTLDYSADTNIGSITVELQGSGDAQVQVDVYSDDFISNVENIIGTGGTDRLRGDGEVNRLEGRGGDDYISGGAGLDTLDGGENTDVTEGGGDWLDYSFVVSNNNLDITLNGSTQTTARLNGVDADLIRNFENVIGSLGDDIIRGDAGQNRFEGRIGNDTFVGNGGADFFNGEGGSDTIDFSQDAFVTDHINVTLNGGSLAFADIDGVSQVYSFINVENIIGTSGNDYIAGDSSVNDLQGMDGDDTIRANTGDTIDGGEGDETNGDTIDLANVAFDSNITADMSLLTGDYFNVSFSGATSGSFQAANFENFMSGRGDDDITGDDTDNVINGSAGDDTLSGLGGDDELYGGDDDDIIYGGDGNDTITGIAGLIDTNGTDTTALGFQIRGEGGDDTIEGGGTLLGGDGNDTITAVGVAGSIIDGGAGDDVITGSAHWDYFQLSRGSDVIDGAGSAYDRLGVRVNLPGPENDYSIDLQSLGETSVTIDLANQGMGGTATFNTLGDVSTIRNIEYIYTDATVSDADGADTISTASDARNIIVTYAGDDYVTTRGGNDVIEMGTGIDTIDFSERPSVVVTNWNTGELEINFSNIVNSRVIATVGNNTVEVGDAERIIGTDYRDLITTADGSLNDLIYLDGGGGNDRIYLDDEGIEVLGGDGDDEIVSRTGGSISIDGGDGTDTISYTDSLFALGGGATITLDVNGDATVEFANDASRNEDIFNFEHITGTRQDDFLTGNADTNYLRGGQSDDTLYASDGADRYYGNGGDDTVDFAPLDALGVTAIQIRYDDGTNDNDLQDVQITGGGVPTQYISYDTENIFATAGDDVLGGNSRRNELRGRDGDDIIEMSTNNDVLDGGAHTNFDTLDARTLALGSGDSFNIDTTGFATFTGGTAVISGFEYYHLTNADDVVETDNAVDETIFTYDGDDDVTASLGNDIIEAGAGNDEIDFSLLSGTQGIVVDLDDTTLVNVTVRNTAFTQQISGFENILGTTAADDITGDDNDNRIQGLEGSDILNGEGGADYFVGGFGVDTIDGGTGIDIVDYETASAGIDVDLENEIAGDDGNFANDILRNLENVNGSLHDDSIIGNSEDNVLTGLTGDDILEGRQGEDTLNGGNGGETNGDTASYTRASSGVTASIADNEASIDGDGSRDDFIGIENLTGSAHVDNLTGSGGNNIIDGGGSNDIIIATAGSDTYIGGGGDNDRLNFSNGSGIDVDMVSGNILQNGFGGTSSTIETIEDIVGTSGNDRVVSSAVANNIELGDGDDTFVSTAGTGVDTFDGGENNETDGDTVDYSGAAGGITVELNSNEASNDGDGSNDILLGIENIIGTDFMDRIYGDADDNDFFGGLMADTFYSSGGQDRMDGGDGIDTVDYSGAAGGINLNLASTIVSDDGDSSNDVLIAIENVIGSSFSDIMVGSTQDNVFTGAGGDDNISGGLGNDTFIAGAGQDTFDGEGGSDDHVDYSSIGSGINVDLENEVASDDGSSSNDILRGIERVTGTDQADVMRGADGVQDTLLGGLGDDQISDSSGNDTIVAGAGNDTVIAAAGNDSYDGGAGTGDVIDYSNATQRIIVDLNGVGSATEDGFGGSDTRVNDFEELIATDLDDRITAGGGDITIIAGDGDDTIFAAETGTQDFDGEGNAGAGDTLSFANFSSGLTTTVSGAASQTLANTNVTMTGFENLIFTASTDNITFSGGLFDINLAGNNDTLNITGNVHGASFDGGNGGADVFDMTGLGGVDRYLDLTAQTLTQGAVVSSFQNFEEFVGSGNADFVSGGTGDDVVDTAGGADEITDDIGNDTIVAGAGDDTVIAAAGNDSYDGGAGTGDVIDYSNATQRIIVDLNGVGSATEDGFGGSDTRVNDFEELIATDLDDRITAGGGDITITAGDGDDTIFAAETGTQDFDGEGNTGVGDTLSFINFSSGFATGISDSVQQTLNNTNVTMAGFENIIFTNLSDNISVLGGSINLDLADGNDSLRLLDFDNGGHYNGGAGNSDTLNLTLLTSSIDLLDLTAQTISYNGSITATFESFESILASGYADTILGGTGNETIDGRGGNDIITDDIGDDTITGGADDDTIIAAAGNDSYDGGADTGDVIDYSNATQRIIVDLNGVGSATEDGFGGSDTRVNDFEELIATDLDDRITAGGGDITITAGDGDDTIFAAETGTQDFDGEGNTGVGDTLSFENFSSGITTNLSGPIASNVTMAGFENLIFTDHADSVSYSGGTYAFDFGAGNDYMEVSGANITELNNSVFDGGSDLGTGSGDEIFFTPSLGYTVDLAAGTLHVGATHILDFSNFEKVQTSLGSDTIIVSAGYYGGFDGNNGADTIDYSNATQGINVDLENETASADGFGGANLDVISFESLIGSNHNDTVTAATGVAQDIQLGVGDDTLIATQISSTARDFDGGTNTGVGDRISYASISTDTTINLTAETAANFFGQDNIFGFENVTGSQGDDTITGTTGTNDIQAGGGDDTVIATIGSDSYDGGANTVTGDTVSFVNFGEAIVSTTIGAGTSTVGTASTSTSINDFENIRTTDLGDNITHNGGQYNFDLGGGDDIININVNDSSTNNSDYDGGGNSGTGDTLDFIATSGLDIDVNAGTVTDGAGYDLTFSNFEQILGGAGFDFFTGSSSNDVMGGGNGDDTFYSSAGSDFINGGNQSDTVDFSGGSAVTSGLFDGSGAETINVGVNGTAVTEVENFIFTSSDDFIQFTENGINAMNGVSGNFDFGGDTGTGNSDSVGYIDTLDSFNSGDFASLFSNLETLDFTSASLTGSFDIFENDVDTITDGGNDLTILVNGSSIGINDFNYDGTNGVDYNQSTDGSTYVTTTWNDGTTITVTT